MNKFYLAARRYKGSQAVSVMLMRADGAAHSSWLSGWMTEKLAERLAKECNLKIEWSTSKWVVSGLTKAGEKEVARNKKGKRKKISPIEKQHHGLIDLRELNES